MEQLNLKGYRCPDAMRMVRQALELADRQPAERLLVVTVEPSMARDLPYYLTHSDGAWSLVGSDTIDLREEDRQQWLTEHGFIEEDLEGLTKQHRFLLARTASNPA